MNVSDQQTELKISISQVQKLVQQVISQEGQICDEVNIYFVDTLTISQLHKQFFDDPDPTDCISFPIDNDPEELYSHRLLGEVFVCPATALTYSNENQGNAYLETTLYIVHGLLHLMGYDDVEEKDILIMRKAEDLHMKHIQSLYLHLQP